MASGGARPNAGRPKGASESTKKGSVVLTPSTRKKVQDAMVERVKDIDITPLEIMLNDMKLHHDEARRLLAAHQAELAEDQRSEYAAKLMAAAKLESAAAVDSAAKVAPYIHAKLQAVTLKGDAENPLEIALGLGSAADLKKLVRGG